MFQLESAFQPAGDQPKAIDEIVSAFRDGERQLTLLGATGTGKTFTMANVIQQLQKPTLILSHNKTLAAQLATECKHFFPKNAVHYFVSYFDYYQPESYVPERGQYIEKEATINKEIEMYRLATMASLLTRPDAIVVSSVSALYGVGSREFFAANSCYFSTGEEYDFDELKKQFIGMQYKPVHGDVGAGMFHVQGDMIDVYASTEKVMYRLLFNDTTLEMIQVKDSLTHKLVGTYDHITIWPATQFLQDTNDIPATLAAITKEMEARVARFDEQGLYAEAQRLKKRVSYDVKMIQETGFVNGIENYSPYFEQRLDGAPPNTLFDYFPDDFLIIVDESHMTIPQFGGMPRADTSRKQSLVDHGFRLPSAVHHRPINFDELSVKLGREKRSDEVHTSLGKGIKDAHTLYVSATPATYELDRSTRIIQQVIRPTGLLDPVTYVYPKSGSYARLEATMDELLKKKPEMKQYLRDYEHRVEHDLF